MSVVNPTSTKECVDALLRELAGDILASEGLKSFLMVESPKTAYYHCFGFCSGIGQPSQNKGNVNRFLGDSEERQKLLLMKHYKCARPLP